MNQRAYLKPAGTQFQSEPTGTTAAMHSPSLKPGLRRYEGGTRRHSIFKEGEQRVGEGGERVSEGVKEREGTAQEHTSGSR